MADVVHHQFLPWVRQGLAAAITTTDPLGGPPPAEPPGRMTVTVPVLGDGADHDDSPVSVHLAVRGAADQLPPLAESWLWAHAQVTPSDGQSVLGALTGDPRANLSRLVCPRRLHANRRYLACVVPAFEAGRKAGLGQDPADADEVAPA